MNIVAFGTADSHMDPRNERTAPLTWRLVYCLDYLANPLCLCSSVDMTKASLKPGAISAKKKKSMRIRAKKAALKKHKLKMAKRAENKAQRAAKRAIRARHPYRVAERRRVADEKYRKSLEAKIRREDAQEAAALRQHRKFDKKRGVPKPYADKYYTKGAILTRRSKRALARARKSYADRPFFDTSKRLRLGEPQVSGTSVFEAEFIVKRRGKAQGFEHYAFAFLCPHTGRICFNAVPTSHAGRTTEVRIRSGNWLGEVVKALESCNVSCNAKRSLASDAQKRKLAQTVARITELEDARHKPDRPYSAARNAKNIGLCTEYNGLCELVDTMFLKGAVYRQCFSKAACHAARRQVKKVGRVTKSLGQHLRLKLSDLEMRTARTNAQRKYYKKHQKAARRANALIAKSIEKDASDIAGANFSRQLAALQKIANRVVTLTAKIAVANR